MSVQNKVISIIFSVVILGMGTVIVWQNLTIIRPRSDSSTQPNPQNSSSDSIKQKLGALPACFTPDDEVDLDRNSAVSKTLQAVRLKVPTGWELNGVCADQSQETAFLVTTSKVVDRKEEILSETYSHTQQLFPKLFVPPYTDEGYYRLYRYFIFATYPTVISYNDTRHTIRANELQPVGREIVWYEGLAGCGIEPGSFFKNDTMTIACGGGDNGCYVQERVQVSLFSGTTRYLGRCEKNCDLESDQPAELKCER